MNYIQGNDRKQSFLFTDCLDTIIGPDNEVRFIDLFAESLNLAEFEFSLKSGTAEGRPPYNPKDLLKLYIYGYLNSIRSSRALEKECHRNIELMWLMKQLAPDHNTISNFRRDNEKAIRKVFRYTVKIASHFELIGGVLVAGDSTKLRAQNSKKRNFNEKKINQHLEYIDKKLEEYNEALADADEDNRQIIQQEIDKQKERKCQYNELQQQLESGGESQISTSDPESRLLKIRSNMTEVAYNIQTTVDAKHNIPIDYNVTNKADEGAMGEMLQRAAGILGNSHFTALYDKGYHTGAEIKAAIELGVNIMVAIPGINTHAPDRNYDLTSFIYNKQDDTYSCPQNQILTTKKVKDQEGAKTYRSPACLQCPVKQLCTNSKTGRSVTRNQFADYIEQCHGCEAYLQETAGNRGTSLRDDKTAMGLQLHYDKKDNEQGRFRCGFDVRCL
jgi:transposase